MLNGGGGANLTSVARVHCVWRKFKELSGILKRNEVSFKQKEKLYVTCVKSTVVFGSETWAMMAEQSGRLECTDGEMDVWCIDEG